ncbi:hypothetical protein HCA58_21825 [Micromonospora sp. HNM0581]|nr:hypothetical protein [Micromonospora sp. HNM0581]NLU80943.1 hypothetical protein [Micromonospora sp. HNM0581]
MSSRDIPVRALKLCGRTWSGDFLWFSEAVSNQLIALDPHTGEVERRLPCPGVRTDLTTMDGLLIQVVGEERRLRVLAPHSGNCIGEMPNPRPGHLLSGLEATRDGIWFGYEDLRLVELRDKRTFDLIDVFRVRFPIAGLTVSDDYLAYADHRAGTVNMFDLQGGRDVASYSVAGSPTGVTWDGRAIWYCDFTTLRFRAIEVPGITKG